MEGQWKHTKSITLQAGLNLYYDVLHRSDSYTRLKTQSPILAHFIFPMCHRTASLEVHTA